MHMYMCAVSTAMHKFNLHDNYLAPACTQEKASLALRQKEQKAAEANLAKEQKKIAAVTEKQTQCEAKKKNDEDRNTKRVAESALHSLMPSKSDLKVSLLTAAHFSNPDCPEFRLAYTIAEAIDKAVDLKISEAQNSLATAHALSYNLVDVKAKTAEIKEAKKKLDQAALV